MDENQSVVSPPLPRGPSEGNGWPWDNLESDVGLAHQKMPCPKISIVTPSYNQGRFIEETIRSVLLQRYPNLEYIIIDGGSTDNSVEIIKKYANRITYWESEKDRGQSHAINKGIARCTGDIFNWVNSDDLLMPGALWAVAEAWSLKPGCIVSGHTELFDSAGTYQMLKAGGQTLRNFVRFWEAQDFGWAPQGTFLPLKALQCIGGVREDLHFCMDQIMMVQLLMNGVEVNYTDRLLGGFRSHPLSKTLGANKNFRLERVTALRSMQDLPVHVEGWEWDAEEARRLVDMARHASRCGQYFNAVRILGRALATSPLGATREILSRSLGKIQRGNDGRGMVINAVEQ